MAEPSHGLVVLTLTRDLAAQVADSLAELDRAASQEWGLLFADDVWDRDAFLQERPGKWTYSRVILDADGRAIAFWISSRHESPLVGVYSHRSVIDAGHQHQGLYSALWASVRDAARSNGEPAMSHSISTSHPVLNRFYEREKCRRLEGQALRDYVAARQLEVQVEHDRIREANGHEKFIYVLQFT